MVNKHKTIMIGNRAFYYNRYDLGRFNMGKSRSVGITIERYDRRWTFDLHLWRSIISLATEGR